LEGAWIQPSLSCSGKPQAFLADCLFDELSNLTGLSRIDEGSFLPEPVTFVSKEPVAAKSKIKIKNNSYGFTSTPKIFISTPPYA
jgi:hypothetical protein